MAHVVRLGALTDELVTLLTSITSKSDPSKFNLYRETTLRNLRHHNFSRTNQFDVTSRLEGLEEKFRIYNEDLLADALSERLEALEHKKIKWEPEILHLLLELSDKPVSHSKLEALDFLEESEVDSGPPLLWKDLVAEDPLLRDKIWKNVDFGAESSGGEDEFEDSRTDISGSDTAQSSIDDEISRRPEEYAVNIVDKQGLEMLQHAQFWKKAPNVGGIKLQTVKKPITELQAIREVVFMLLGLPTSLFETGSDKKMIVPARSYAMKHASTDAFIKLLETFADNGSMVAILRTWTNRTQSIPLMQVFQSSVFHCLSTWDAFLSTIQQRLVAIETNVIVSLLRIQEEIDSSLRYLSRLSKIIQQLEQEQYSHAFRYLEMLYDEICTSQMAGDDKMYAFIGKIFFDCFQVYLGPLRNWMEDGDLKAGESVFFVSETFSDVAKASIWQSRYKIRQTQAGVLHAPRFLRAAANKIFTTGKSVVVLKHLNKTALRSRDTPEPVLDFETVCDPSQLQLAPFPELFEVAFDAWVQSKHHLASSTLRTTLFESCNLHMAFDAISNVYFMANGSASAGFTNSIFDKLDTLDVSWNDRFALTELAQRTFGSIPAVSPDHLRTHPLSLPRKVRDIAKCRRSVKTLAVVEFKYHLSWPIQIILTTTSISSYQRVFTFLFQIRRSSHILSRHRLIEDSLTHTSSFNERAMYYSLRNRLIWFTQTLYHYLTSLVIEPSSLYMREQLRESKDVDAMIEVHDEFIKSIIDQSLLGNKLEVIHKTILKILDLAIKLEDVQAANATKGKEALEQQQDMMDRSMASLGLHTSPKRLSAKSRNAEADSSDYEDEKEIDIDLSILSSTYDDADDETYVEILRKMKADFNRLGRFVANGLRGVARAGGGNKARNWDLLGEMLQSGLESGNLGY